MEQSQAGRANSSSSSSSDGALAGAAREGRVECRTTAAAAAAGHGHPGQPAVPMPARAGEGGGEMLIVSSRRPSSPQATAQTQTQTQRHASSWRPASGRAAARPSTCISALLEPFHSPCSLHSRPPGTCQAPIARPLRLDWAAVISDASPAHAAQRPTTGGAGSRARHGCQTHRARAVDGRTPLRDTSRAAVQPAGVSHEARGSLQPANLPSQPLTRSPASAPPIQMATSIQHTSGHGRTRLPPSLVASNPISIIRLVHSHPVGQPGRAMPIHVPNPLGLHISCCSFGNQTFWFLASDDPRGLPAAALMRGLASSMRPDSPAAPRTFTDRQTSQTPFEWRPPPPPPNPCHAALLNEPINCGLPLDPDGRPSLARRMIDRTRTGAAPVACRPVVLRPPVLVPPEPRPDAANAWR